MLPNSHTLLSCRPLSYFLLTKKVLSISTTTPSSLIGCWLLSQSNVTLEQKLHQPILVCPDHLRDLITVQWSHTFCNQWLQNKSTCHTSRYVSSKKVPLKFDTIKLHCLLSFFGGGSNFLYLPQLSVPEYHWCFSNLSLHSNLQLGQLTVSGKTPCEHRKSIPMLTLEWKFTIKSQ